jgi:hypothetical protein
MKKIKLKSKTEPSNPYEYSALWATDNPIRLLIVQGERDPADNIRCVLCQTSLEKKLKYEALSYTWGSAENKRRVWIGSKELWVTSNLDCALRYLRPKQPGKNRVLWIDAVCIDQDDTAERTSQVQQMGDIYKCSEQVIVWLGPESENTKGLLSSASRPIVSPVPTNLWAGSDFWKEEAEDQEPTGALRVTTASEYHREALASSPYWKEEQVSKKAIPGHLGGCPGVIPGQEMCKCKWTQMHIKNQYLGFAKLLARPWFLRMWVVQEIVLASKVVVQCGSSSAS